MSVKIRKRVKKYNRGISKAVSPSKTLQVILKKINKLEPGILDRYCEVKANTKIPQYIVRGTDYYLQNFLKSNYMNFRHLSISTSEFAILHLAGLKKHLNI